MPLTMRDKPRFLVLMATENGQAFLNQQLKSVLGQRGVEVTLKVSDSCSTDSTFRILETFAQEHPNIELRYDAKSRARAEGLLDLVYGAEADDYDFIALADQKDVWHPDKLLAASRRISANTSRPELYYCGVREIDERGRTIGLGKEGARDCAAHPASLLLVRNWAPACTMVMNGALVKLLRSFSTRSPGRSCATWIHAVALYCGGFVYADLAHRYASARILPGEQAVPAEPPEAYTQMAGELLRGYAEEMLPETARLVSDVARRRQSIAARLRLRRNKDIVALSKEATRRLRRALLFNRI